MDTITGAMMKAFMQYGQERTQTLTQNIANANTPKYVAQDVTKPGSFAQLLSTNSTASVAMSTTSSMHFQSSKVSGRFKVAADKDAGPAAMDGNNVSLPEQTMKLNETRQDYATAAKAYSTMNSAWSIVMGKNK